MGEESAVPSSVTRFSVSDLTFAAVIPVGYGLTPVRELVQSNVSQS